MKKVIIITSESDNAAFFSGSETRVFSSGKKANEYIKSWEEYQLKYGGKEISYARFDSSSRVSKIYSQSCGRENVWLSSHTVNVDTSFDD